MLPLARSDPTFFRNDFGIGITNKIEQTDDFELCSHQVLWSTRLVLCSEKVTHDQYFAGRVDRLHLLVSEIAD